jgi:hypothetical protein
MAHDHLGLVLREVRALLVAPGGAGATDAQLLHRFVAGRDETAFQALLQRHGPMVLSGDFPRPRAQGCLRAQTRLGR